MKKKINLRNRTFLGLKNQKTIMPNKWGYWVFGLIRLKLTTHASMIENMRFLKNLINSQTVEGQNFQILFHTMRLFGEKMTLIWSECRNIAQNTKNGKTPLWTLIYINFPTSTPIMFSLVFLHNMVYVAVIYYTKIFIKKPFISQ